MTEKDIGPDGGELDVAKIEEFLAHTAGEYYVRAVYDQVGNSAPL